MPNTTRDAVTDAVRQFNKYLLNPVMLRLAGRRHWYAAAIHHVGRTTGRKYATPVVADRVMGGFIIPLPYGVHVDWLRNAIAANYATITVDGLSFDITDPRIIGAETAARQLSSRRRRIFKRFGVTDFVTFDVQAGPTSQTRTSAVKEHHGR